MPSLTLARSEPQVSLPRVKYWSFSDLDELSVCWQHTGQVLHHIIGVGFRKFQLWGNSGILFVAAREVWESCWPWQVHPTHGLDLGDQTWIWGAHSGAEPALSCWQALPSLFKLGFNGNSCSIWFFFTLSTSSRNKNSSRETCNCYPVEKLFAKKAEKYSWITL